MGHEYAERPSPGSELRQEGKGPAATDGAISPEPPARRVTARRGAVDIELPADPPAHGLPRPATSGRIRRATSTVGITRKAAAPKRIGQRTALSDDLKAGIESLSGISMEGVQVHHDSTRPARLHALAYTVGADIHLGPGQDEHLAHEAWHVVQQAQGRVRPTTRFDGGLPVNDDEALEREADVMGARALAGPRRAAGEIGEIGEIGEVGEVVEPRIGASAVQLRWGQFDGRDRDRARTILAAVNRIDPFDYELGGVLEQLIHDGLSQQDVQAALVQMPNHFTTVERATSLTNHLAAGLPLAFAQVAVHACPADDARLEWLLALFAQLHPVAPAPGLALARVCSQLLVGNQPPPPLVAAVQQVPDLLTTVARANAVMAHRQAGGTDADARLAAHCAGGDDVALAEMLTALRALATIPAFGAMDQGRQVAVLGERAHLTTDVLRANAVSMAAAATNENDAAEALRDNRDFGYRSDFATHAGTRASQHRQATELAATQSARATAAADRRRAVDDVSAQAAAALSSKFRRGLDAPDTAKGREATQKLHEKQQQLAAGAITTIDQREAQSLQDIQQVTGPQAYATRSGQFQAWFQSVGFHADALAALTAANDDFALASSIITTLSAAASTRQLLTRSGLAVDEITRLVALGAPHLAHFIAGGMAAPEFKAFAATRARVALLAHPAVATVPVANMCGLVPYLVALEPQITIPAEAAHLVTLLTNDTAREIVAMRDAAPNPANAKLALLVAIRPKAAAAADLTTVLTFCTGARWDQAKINSTLGPLANGRTLAQLQAAVHAAELRRYNRVTEFAGWLYAADRLVQAGYVTVQANGGWSRLRGEPTTDEQRYDVVNTATRIVEGTFVVHFHPGAVRASVDNPNASRSHLKPGRHGDERYYTPDMLTHIKPLIEVRPH